ncbi:Gfo/Idh/MocA family oxidoreductase [Stieleria sp. JC731]|uniref:Gfo/Idh/MocA family protein n=1 Tax=Pirellulaceae TaxID=2691357 RepID=UPI001E33F6F1|nr:Gfo/Idh/MocA family oxidoreductase [Stieleria sp. JC731]MCC9599412.1 Gfo/Idh/MocA family oxidoreductase [Stieleria sp. JC731]
MNLFENTNRDRRLFLAAMATTAVSIGSNRASGQDEAAAETNPVSPNDRLSIGIMGVNGRGAAIAKGMLATGQVDISYICDVDRRAADRVAKLVGEKQSTVPKTITDFRNLLDDNSVDVLVCAAPNHWHAPATILGCKAGKHVYVEKPCSYTPAEGEMAVAAARKHDRIVQMGTQRRTWPGIVAAIEKVHSGAIGKVLYSRSWYNNRRGSIGHGKQTAVPEWLDWKLWQGPAPDRPFKDNVVHYNWHWHWHWGNGEIGNNGVHALDVARWGMQVDYPIAVSVGGGKYRHDDDQETPDTMMATFDFEGGKTITWEGLSWSPLGPHDSRFGISFHGTDGSIVLRDKGFVQFDNRDNQVDQGEGEAGDQGHFMNFIDSVRNGERPNADIEIAHKSTLLCHLGNIAYRTGTSLKTDPKDGRPINSDGANSLWTREYAKGWEPTV